jgi:hypothetical protein
MWSYINHICNLVNHRDFDIRKRVCRKEHELYENLVDHHFDIRKRVVERNMSCMKTWWIITLLLKKEL